MLTLSQQNFKLEFGLLGQTLLMIQHVFDVRPLTLVKILLLDDVESTL